MAGVGVPNQQAQPAELHDLDPHLAEHPVGPDDERRASDKLLRQEERKELAVPMRDLLYARISELLAVLAGRRPDASTAELKGPIGAPYQRVPSAAVGTPE